MRVEIVGGGVFGVAAARSLALRGHDVTLREAGEIPSEHAASRDVSKLYRLAYGDATGRWAPRARAAMRTWREVEAEDGGRFLHDAPFFAASSTLGPGTFERASADALEALGTAHEVIAAAELARRAPALASLGAAGALVDHEAGWFAPVEAVAALAASAARAGARLLTRAPVARLDDLAADAVVVAAGGWVGRLVTPPAQVRVTLQHEFLFSARAGAGAPPPPWSFDIATTGFYGFPPLPDGRIKVALHRLGDRVEDSADKPAPTPGERAEVARFVEARLPGLDATRMGFRSCQYTTAGDGTFVFAPVAGRDGVFVAGCGGGHAFKFGPLLGEWAADLVEGTGVPEDLRGAAGDDAGRVV